MTRIRSRNALALVGVVAALGAFTFAVGTPTPTQASPPAGPAPVGLSLWWEDGEVRFEDGTPKTVTLYSNAPRFAHEIDITASIETATDEGIDPIMASGDMAGLDWTGVELVEEDWRPEFTGGFTRSRFYRGAAWMNRFSIFTILPVNDAGHPVGLPILEIAGLNDAWLPVDDGFVRRFVARQVTPGCQAVGDCSNATSFIAQGLVQIRGEMHAEQRARKIPPKATQLKLIWTEDLDNPRFVPIERASFDETPYRYGFVPEIEVVNEPANGDYFVPGETLQVRTTFRDGAGNRLHPEGSLPTYGDFLDQSIDSGLRYYDGLRQLLTPYYALKHREGLLLLSMGGPTDALKNSSHMVGLFDLFFTPQTTTATVAEDGFSGVFQLNPPIQNQALPELWDAPVSDTIPLVVPEDALPGTYVIAVKARRDWGGEALNRGATVEVRVGQTQPTGFAPTTGNCQSCHQGNTSLGKVLHGLGDRRACYSCHQPMAFEPDHALDYRIHLVHSRSERYPADIADCSTCHLEPPDGPPRGYPGFGPL
jgi:hypothetical protein